MRRDFKAIAKNMGLNRTTAACKSFFSKNRVRCQLDEALQQHKEDTSYPESREQEGDVAKASSFQDLTSQDSLKAVKVLVSVPKHDVGHYYAPYPLTAHLVAGGG